MIVFLIILLEVVDVYCYLQAPYPERHKLLYVMPLIGGPLALLRLGRRKKNRDRS